MNRMGQLRQVFNANISFALKMRIYKSAVCSILTYGSEAWNLDEQTKAAINGANAKCMSRITGRSIHEEASTRTRTYDLLKDIRQRRHKWLGHILRMPADRLVKTAVKVQYQNAAAGNIFMDTPKRWTFEEIERAAQNRRLWKRMWTYPSSIMFSVPPAPPTQSHYHLRSGPPPSQASASATAPSPSTSNTTAPKKTRNAFKILMKAKQKQTKRQKEQVKQSKRPKTWTDEQRRAWAHAHYIANHGTRADARCFLSSKSNVTNTATATLAKLKLMTAVPAWENAAAAVFDSSSDSGDIMDSSNNDNISSSQNLGSNHDNNGESPTTPCSNSTINTHISNSSHNATTSTNNHDTTDENPTTPRSIPRTTTPTDTPGLTSITPTILGHLHPTHTQDTHNNHSIHLTLSPIDHHNMDEHPHYTQFECTHTHTHTQTRTHQPYISILNDTYLVIYNN